MTSSIDLLEECLNISHRMRKAAIQSRSHKKKASSHSLPDKQTFKVDQKVIIRGKLFPPERYAVVVEALPNKRCRIYWEHNEHVEILESKKLKEWTPPKKDIFDDEDEEVYESPSKGKANGMKLSGEYKTLDSQKDDLIAQRIFESFKNELNEWWLENPLLRDDEDARGRVADDLSERYMCVKLDPLPASRVVTHIRRSVAEIIEGFACDGVLPPDIAGEIVVKKKKKPITAYEIMKAKEEADKQVNESYEKKREEEREKMTAKDRQEKEKSKIKEQYESYMRLKTKAATEEDEIREKEIESHLEDIKSLISTFHKNE